MQVHVQFLVTTVTILEMLVTLLIQSFGGFTVGLAHGLVLGLASYREGLGGASIVAIPCLCGAVDVLSRRGVKYGEKDYLCRNLLRTLPCLMASARYFRYCALAFEPVSSHGMCCGSGTRRAATLSFPP